MRASEEEASEASHLATTFGSGKDCVLKVR